MILGLLRTSLGQFWHHSRSKQAAIRLVWVSLGVLRGATKGSMVPRPELMEPLLHTLFQIHFDRFPPENHNCCCAPTKTVLTRQSKHGEFTSVTMVEGSAIKTLPLWCFKVPHAPIWGPEP